MNLTYNKAYKDLIKLVEEIEDDKTQLDVLGDKVKKAKELIDFCESKLRSIDNEVQSVLESKKPIKKRKVK